MDQIIFKSIKKENIRYVVTKSHYDVPNSNFYHSPGSYVGNNCFQFDTLGDGEVQHTPLYLVAGADIEDFSVSLAIFISENHSIEMWEVLHYDLSNYFDPEEIKFLYNIRVKEGKATYINLKEMKKTTAESKRHDKRWEKLSDDYEPDFEHIYPFFNQSFYGLLIRLQLAEKIREATGWNIWVDYEGYFKIPNFSNIRDSLKVIESFMSAYKNLEYIKSSGGCIRHNMRLDAVPVDLPETV